MNGANPPAARPVVLPATSTFQAFGYEVTASHGALLGSWEEDGASYAWAETAGVRHVLASAPGLGAEHHAIVPFSLRSTVLLSLVDGAAAWSANGDHELASWVRAHPAFHAAAARVAWTTYVAPGAPPLCLEWTLQVRPVGNGYAHVVLRVGDYNGGTGLLELLTIVQMLRGAVPFAPHPAAPFTIEPAFGQASARVLGVLPSSAPPPPSRRSVSYAPPMSASYVTVDQAEQLVNAIALAHSTPSITPPPPASEEDYTARVNRAGRCFLRGKYKEFVDIWETIARERPDERGPALQQVGNGYYAMRDYVRALHYYETALAAGGELHDIHGDIRNARRKLGT